MTAEGYLNQLDEAWFSHKRSKHNSQLLGGDPGDFQRADALILENKLHVMGHREPLQIFEY